MRVEWAKHGIKAFEIQYKVRPVENVWPEEIAGTNELAAPHSRIHCAQVRATAGDEQQAVVCKRVQQVREHDGA